MPMDEINLKYQEYSVEGLENAPETFPGLFAGRNGGELLVRVTADPTRARQANQGAGAAATSDAA